MGKSVSSSKPMKRQRRLYVPESGNGVPVFREWMVCALLSNRALCISPNSSTASVGCPQGACQTMSVPSVGRRSLWRSTKKGSLKTPTSSHAIMCILFTGNHMSFIKPMMGGNFQIIFVGHDKSRSTVSYLPPHLLAPSPLPCLAPIL